MKKIILSSLLCSTILLTANAADSKYELIPTIGYTDEVESNREETYMNYGLAIARNFQDSFISQAEIAYLRSADVDAKNSNESTNVNRAFLNAIKDFGITKNLSLFGLAGIGYQDYTNEKIGESQAFANYGAGLKYKFENLSLRADARHLVAEDDQQLLFTLGLILPFSPIEKPKPVMVKQEVKKVEAKVIVKDADNDGVIDSKDRCPNTPADAKVNMSGCELDSDKDGVVDRLDNCSNTPSGAEVDGNGCTKKLELKINFDSNSSAIRAEDRTEIQALAAFLKNQNNQDVIIEAHTDSRGSAKYNMNLSKKRAASAKNALVKLGVASSRVEDQGYGETQPIADNSTKEGREENRRITVIFK